MGDPSGQLSLAQLTQRGSLGTYQLRHWAVHHCLLHPIGLPQGCGGEADPFQNRSWGQRCELSRFGDLLWQRQGLTQAAQVPSLL